MTGAAPAVLAVLVLLTAAAPAAAGFRYVPEAADGGVVATPAEVEPDDPAPASGPLLWRVRESETLRATLSRWGTRSGADVTFLTDRRYRLDAAAAFESAFRDAVEAVFRGLAHLPHPPAGAFSADGRSLTVTHRTRRTAEPEDAR